MAHLSTAPCQDDTSLGRFTVFVVELHMLSVYLFSLCIFSEAVYRYYESRRRLFNDCQPGRREKAEKLKVHCKRTNYQKKASVLLSMAITGFSVYFLYSCTTVVNSF